MVNIFVQLPTGRILKKIQFDHVRRSFPLLWKYLIYFWLGKKRAKASLTFPQNLNKNSYHSKIWKCMLFKELSIHFSIFLSHLIKSWVFLQYYAASLIHLQVDLKDNFEFQKCILGKKLYELFMQVFFSR